MPREPTIPIFLWITTAILLHILGYGGSERVVTHVEARRSLQQFVGELLREAKSGPRELEIALLDQDAGPEEAPDTEDPPDEEPVPGRPPLVPAPSPPELPEEEPDDPSPPDAEPQRAPEAAEEPAREPAQELTLPPMDRRVAVEQHVEDPDQEDNPDARFIAEHANRVERETRASITSLDRNDPVPTPGRAHEGPSAELGDADDTRIAQSEDKPGAEDTQPEAAAAAATASEPASPPPAGGPPPPPAARAVPEPALPAVESNPAPELLSSGEGAWEGGEGRAARPARSASPRRLPPPRARPGEIYGYGRSGTTANGVNLNLSPAAAVAAVGAEQLAAERRQDGERRRSQHRGSNRPLGIERWRSAIENYVASVQPGNQTALNTARVPFARYLHQVHLKIHPVFADSFLRSLDSLPASDPLNRPELQTHLELVLHPDDGHLVRMGVTRSSGVTAFDVGALESISTASPFGRAPSSIVSPDGNVYLHWEFHRQPWIACGTFNARPYILKAQPRPAEPRVPPPLRPEDPSRDERHGALSVSAAGPLG